MKKEEMRNKNEAVEIARELCSRGDYDYYAWRVSTPTCLVDNDIPEYVPTVGTVLPPSHVWVDGEPTAEELPGTCGIMISPRHDNYLAALDTLLEYTGNYVLLIAGNRAQAGEDKGEIIIRDARCLAVWER